jgi:hypothetical protein
LTAAVGEHIGLPAERPATHDPYFSETAYGASTSKVVSLPTQPAIPLTSTRTV